jgi:hypothetical protein
MDPDEALARARAAYVTFTSTEDPETANDAAEAIAETFTALDGFLSRGGFLPAAWSAGRPVTQ